MSDFSTDNNLLVQELLQERDELFQKLCRLQKINEDALGGLEAQNKELSSEVARKDQEIKKLTDQLAWFRQKYFSKSSEKFIKEDPNQRKLRSEEHTSELQSRPHLVCRLLLEKK